MKRLISVFMTLCLLVGLLPAIPLTAQAATAATAASAALWTDFADESFAGGDGSYSHPYLIATAEQLAYLAVQVNSGNAYDYKYFELVNNIDLSAYLWVPIGEQNSTPFNGEFHGNGHTISGLTMTSDSVFYDYCGLFGYGTGKISYLNMTNVNISIENDSSVLQIGSVIGYSWGLCNNVAVSGNIRITNRNTDPIILECGGIVGAGTPQISNCSFTGNIYLSGAYNPQVGGIVGEISEGGSVGQCRTDGGIVMDNTYGTVNYAEVGGIAGISTASHQNCYSNMNISLKTKFGVIGGLIGTHQSRDISNCYATGTISGEFSAGKGEYTYHCAGGLIGCWWTGNVKNCYTRNPSVTCTKSNTEQETYAGKLAGYANFEIEGNNISCTNCYVSNDTTLKRNGYQAGGGCESTSYPIVNSANSESQPKTNTFTYSESFITDTLGWKLYTNGTSTNTSTKVWVLGGTNPELFIDHIRLLRIRYWDPGDNHFDTFSKYYLHGSEYRIVSPDLSGAAPDQAVVSGTITENTYIDVYYTHQHEPGPEATCTAPQTCTLCGGVLAEQLPHNYAVTEVLQSSCTENGYTLHTCQSCGVTHRDNYTDPLGHELDSNNICTRCGIAFEAPLRDYRVHVLDQETGKPLSGVTVTLGERTVVTNTAGIAAYQLDSEGPFNLIATLDGYQSHSVSGFVPGELPDTYVYLSAKDTGIYDARCNNNDVLIGTTQVNCLAPLMEATIVAKGRAKADITHYELVQGDTIIATSWDGTFKVKNPHFKQNQPVYVRMHTDGLEGSNVFSQKLNIKVVGFTLDVGTDWGKLLPFSAGVDLSFPEGTPVLDGANIKIPSYIFGKNGFTKIQVGNHKVMISIGDKSDQNKNPEDLDNKTKAQILKKMRDDWIKQNHADLWPDAEKKNEVTASFGLVVEFNDSGVTSVYGQVNVAYELSYERGKTFLLGFIPIYGQVNASFGGELQVKELGYDFENAQVLIPDVELTIKGELSLRAGIGCSVISAGVYGTAGAQLTFGVEDLQEYFAYRIYGEMGLYARLKLFFWKALEYRLPLLCGETTGRTARQAMYSLECYETVTRDYLKNRSQWLSYVPRSGSVPENADLQTSSYTAIEPKLVTCADTVMMVFADDDGTDGLNYQHLYYSLYLPDGTWSLPKRVDNNELCDLEYEVGTDGKNIWITYTQMEAVTADTQDDYETLMSSVEVTAAVYDAQNDCFTGHTVLTDNESFDTQPQLAMTPEGLRVAWVSNVTNDAFGQNANNRLFAALYSDGTWSAPVALTQPGATVVSMDLGLLKDTAYLATVLDVDCDLSTIEDHQLVLIDMNGSATTVFTENNTNDAVRFGLLNGQQSLLWYRDSNLYTISAPADTPAALFENPVEGMGSDYRLLTLDQSQQVILYPQQQRWTDVEGNEHSGRNLQAIFSANGTWTAPVAMTTPEADRYVEGYDACVLDGKLLIPHISMNATVSDTDIQRSADFRCTYAAMPRDLVAGQAICLPSQLLEQDAIEVKVPFTNNSNLPVEHVNYRVTDVDGRLLKEETSAAPAGSGEEGYVTVLLPQSVLTPGNHYTVTLLPEGWIDEDLSNNAADLTLWYGDLSVNAEQLLLENQMIHYAVSNEGNDLAQGKLEFLLKEEDGSETLLYRVNIQELAPGKTFSGTLEIDDTLCDSNRVVLVRATADSPELYDFNNETSLTLQPLVWEEITEVPETDNTCLSPEIADPHVIYDLRNGGSLSIPVTENDWCFASVSGIPADSFSYSDSILILDSDWLRSLNQGIQVLTLSYQKDALNTTVNLILEITDTTPPSAQISAPDQILQFSDEAPLLEQDITYETDSLGAVSAFYSLDGTTDWNAGLPHALGTYYVRLTVAEDSHNNLGEANCIFKLEIIKGRRAISLPQVTALTDGSYRFDGAIPTAGLDDGTVSYGCSTVNDPTTVEQWNDVGLISNQDSSVTYYLFARISGGENFEDAYSLGVILDIHIHTYEASVTQPTCEDPGFTTHICSGCADQYTDAPTAALGHSFTTYVYDGNTTCTKDGSETALCDRCDATDTRVLEGSATGHRFDDGIITTQPGCTQEGVLTFTCGGCGEQYTTVLPASGHRYETVVTPPGCEEAGFTVHTCAVCGHSYTDSPQEPTGHSFDNGIITVEPLCTQSGVLTFTCSGCGFQYTTELPVLGHRYTGEISAAPGCEVGGTLTYCCESCGDCYEEAIAATGHRYITTVTAPTCETPGFTTHLCSLCGDSYTDGHLDALGHSFTKYSYDHNATCETDGTKTAQCDRCSAVDTVADPGTAIGHRYAGTIIQAPDCTQDGAKVYRCDHCGDAYQEVLAASGHRYEATVTAPGCETDGYTTHCCTVCGDTFTDSITPATGHAYVEGYCQGCGGFQPGYAILSGTVTSFGNAADSVTVELIPEGSDTAAYRSVITDGSTYRFCGIDLGNYKLAVSKKNHVTRYYSVTVVSGDFAMDLKICLLGDITGEGNVNVGDVGRLYSHLRKTNMITDGYALACADVTGDGRLNMGDAGALYGHTRNTKKLY